MVSSTQPTSRIRKRKARRAGKPSKRRRRRAGTPAFSVHPERYDLHFHALIAAAQPHVLSILLLDPAVGLHDPACIVDQGTAVLLRTDTARFLLTARHVVEGYRGKLVAALGAPNGQNPTDITHWRIIDESRALDVATIEVPRGFDERSIGKVSLRATIPLARAQQGDSVAFFGFPGLHRRHETEPRGVRLALDGFSDFVVSASERGFVIADERGERQVFEYVEGLPPLGPTGGVSGAGVFVRRGARSRFAASCTREAPARMRGSGPRTRTSFAPTARLTTRGSHRGGEPIHLATWCHARATPRAAAPARCLGTAR